MKAPYIGARARHFINVWMLVAWCTSIGEAATITGVVRDVQGNPLDGALIKIICEQAPPKNVQVTTDKDGAYRFVNLSLGECQLSAERSGFRVANPVVVKISSASSFVVSDFTLSQLAQEGDTSISPPRPKLEAAGVRGLIDPGGYSAPANAAAATELISGIADIKRTKNGSGSLPLTDLPCTIEPELTKAVTANPQDVDSNRRLGEFYLAHGSANQAILYLKQALQIDSSDSRIVRDLSEALLINGQFGAAHELLSRQPAGERDADFHKSLARAAEGSGQFIEASGEYRLAAEKDPSELNSFGIGYELILAGQPEVASRAFNTGLALYPSSMTLLIGAGTAEFLEGRSSAALKLFLQAANSNPSDPRPYSFLARAFEISGTQVEEVRASLKQHLELSPNDAEAHYFYALGLLHGNAGGVINTDRAESLLKQAIALDPGLTKAHFQLGILYAHQDHYESAAREFEAAVRLAPDMKEAHYRLAAAYKKTGRAEAAEREMESFREARESIQAEKGEGGISLEQFISVIDRLGHPAASEIQCPQNFAR